MVKRFLKWCHFNSSTFETLNSEQHQNWGETRSCWSLQHSHRALHSPQILRCWSGRGLELSIVTFLGLLDGFWIQDQHFHILPVLVWTPLAAARSSLFLTAPGKTGNVLGLQERLSKRAQNLCLRHLHFVSIHFPSFLWMFPPGSDKPGLSLPPVVATLLLWLLNPLFVPANGHQKKIPPQTFPLHGTTGIFPRNFVLVSCEKGRAWSSSFLVDAEWQS